MFELEKLKPLDLKEFTIEIKSDNKQIFKTSLHKLMEKVILYGFFRFKFNKFSVLIKKRGIKL